MSSDPQRPSSQPNLSRVQVYLYALLALFGGVLLAGAVRSATEAVLADRMLVALVGGGILLGGALALVAIALVVRVMRGLGPDRRYRLARLHTVSLTGVVVLFLLVASVRPSLIAPDSAGTQLVIPSNLLAAVPLAAALTTLVALAVAYRRVNRTP